MKASLAARETASRELLIFPRPAGKRDNIAPAGRAGLGGSGPVQNRFDNISKNNPAILFSIRRVNDGAVRNVRRLDPSAGPASAVPGKSAGADTSNHLQLHTEFRTRPRFVRESGFMLRKRSLLSAQLLAQAREWANELTAMEITGPGDLEAAWRRIETRYSIPYSAMWSLRYRADLKDVWASIYELLRLAVEHERSRRAAQAGHQQFITKAVGTS